MTTPNKPSGRKNMVVKNPLPPWFKSGEIAKAIRTSLNLEVSGQMHSAIGPALREIIDDIKSSKLIQSTSPSAYSQKLSRTIDEIIKTLTDEYQIAYPHHDEGFAVIATGGYGRSDLAPHSDIDLLILHEGQSEDNLRTLTNTIIYPLWDAGLKIGYGMHTVTSAVQLARSDFSARTAFLDRRLLIGKQDLHQSFHDKYLQLQIRSTNHFMNAKLDEMEMRHEKFEQSRFLVEPDIKEGKGGLRDLHMMYWIAHYLYGENFLHNKNDTTLLLTQEMKTFKKSHKFLVSIRHHLHRLTGDDNNHLSFDYQPEVANALGYKDLPNVTAAEQLMIKYFQTATDIGRLLRIFCARLEQSSVKKIPSNTGELPKILSKDNIGKNINLTLNHGRLDFINLNQAQKNPLDWFRLLNAYAHQDKFDVHPDAIALITNHLRALDNQNRKDPQILSLFQSMLVKSKKPIKLLRIMMETGLLPKFIPSFQKISGRIVYGLYRRFTLDEQAIRAVGILAEIKQGTQKDIHPIATGILSNKQNLFAYYFTVLMHEMIYSIPNNDQDTCMRKATLLCKQMGMAPQSAENNGWCIANRLLMIDTVERRSLSDSRTIKSFCELVGSQARLDLLLVQTVCHLRVVNAYSWGLRIRRRISELYKISSIFFSGGEKALSQYQRKTLNQKKKEIEDELKNWSKKDKHWLFSTVHETALSHVEPALWRRFAPLILNAKKQNLTGAVHVSLREDGTIEAIIYGKDRIGLLSDLAGVVANLSISVLSVQAITTSDHHIIDILVLKSIDGTPLTDPSLEKSLHETLLTTISSTPQKGPKLKRRFGDRRSIFHVPASVTIDISGSEDSLIVEAIGLDRPGLLHHLTRELNGLGVLIHQAYVTTYGERAVDSFYLQEMTGEKITQRKRIATIEKRLLKVLSAGDS